jgi:hypothetical protein
MARKLTKLNDVAKIPQTTYSADAQVQRNSESGLSWLPVGPTNTKYKVGQSIPVLLYNSTGTVVFIKFGNDADCNTAPTAAANGIPVLPNSTIVYNSGSNDWMVSNSSGLFAYLADSV